MSGLDFPRELGIKLDYPIYLDETDAAWKPMLAALWDDMCSNRDLPSWEPEVNELVPIIAKVLITQRDGVESVYVSYAAAVVVMDSSHMHSTWVIGGLTLAIELDELMDTFGPEPETEEPH